MSKNFHTNLDCTNIWQSIELINENVNNGIVFDNQDVQLVIPSSFPVFLFHRINRIFKLRTNEQKPLILISTGTGIAPFLSYLELLHNLMQTRSTVNDVNNAQTNTIDIDSNNRKEISAENCKFKTEFNEQTEIKIKKKIINKKHCPNIFFMFGCRNPYQDFLYPERIISYCKDLQLIDHLCLCFSRTSQSERIKFENEYQFQLCNSNNKDNGNIDDIKHVDQLILLHGPELVDWIINYQALIYVCGNWKLISDGIIKAFSTILALYHFNNEDNTEHCLTMASNYLKQMQNEGRFCQDIWT